MKVRRKTLGLDGTGWADIINVKLGDPYYVDMVIRQQGYFRGYHIRGGNWISILLDGTVPFDEICKMIDESFIVTASELPENEEVLMVMDLGYAAEGIGPLPKHTDRKPLEQTVSFM